jgi:hypothetical protein
MPWIFTRNGRSPNPTTFYTFASGILGWNLPAAVGIALAERDSGRKRAVIAIIATVRSNTRFNPFGRQRSCVFRF